MEFLGFPNVALAFESLTREHQGIELLSVRRKGDSTLATAFVPEGKLVHFEKMISDYVARRRDSIGRARDNRRLDGPREAIGEEASGPTLLLGLGKGHQVGDFHPSRQGLRNLGQQEKVGRTGQDEPARSAIQVHRELDRRQKLGSSLNLVDGHFSRLRRNDARRIRCCNRQVGGMIKAHVGAVRHHGANQSGLAALAGSGQAYDRRIRQGIAQIGGERARVEQGRAGHGSAIAAICRLQ